jgi:mono/diheme cytochrome c family protein
MSARLSIVASVIVALSACAETGTPDLAEWTPADHQQETTADDERRAAPDEVDADPAATELRAATSLFGAMCATCHGTGGAGDGPGRPPVAQIPSFADASFQAGRTDEELATVIRDGRGGFMPAFGDRLSPEGIAALVRHVRRFGPSPRATSPDAPPVDPATAPPIDPPVTP